MKMQLAALAIATIQGIGTGLLGRAIQKVDDRQIGQGLASNLCVMSAAFAIVWYGIMPAHGLMPILISIAGISISVYVFLRALRFACSRI